MSARVSVRLPQNPPASEPAGPPNERKRHREAAVAVKVATEPEEIARLADEAERVQQARHPGVVAFVDHRVMASRAELHTRYAGESLELWTGTLAQVAGVAAGVATTLADLHELGLVHGRIDATHVLIGSDGRPQLCGFSPPMDGHQPVEAADDVAAVGRLLEQMIGKARTIRGASARPSGPWAPRAIVARGWLAGFRGPLAERRALGQVVEQATDPSPTRRPTARALARSILAAVPGADLPPAQLAPTVDLFDQAFVDQTDVGAEDVFANRPWHDTRVGRHLTESPRPETIKLVAAAAAVLGVVGGAALLLGPGIAGSPAQLERGQSGNEGGGLDESVPAGNNTEGSSILDGVVEVAGERWAVGEPDDEIALGDWNCDGTTTPAAYRPSTGHVFIFTDWAAHGDPLTAEPIAQVEGGVSLATITSGQNGTGDAPCDVPAVDLRDGGRWIVEVKP